MKELSVRPRVALSVLPPWDAQYKGAVVYQLSDNKLYYAADSAWVQIGAGGGTPGGDSGSVQFNSEGALGGAANILVDNGDLVLALSSSPVTPATDTVKLFGRRLANRMLPAAVGPSGFDSVMQPSLWRNKIGRWNPPGSNTGSPGIDGMIAPVATGNTVARGTNTSNLLTRTRRLGYTNNGVAATFAGHYQNVGQITVGDGNGLGGFFYSCRFGMSSSSAVPTSLKFVGLSAETSAPTTTNTNPYTRTNFVGLVKRSNSNNWFIMYAGSTNDYANTSSDLGENFPADTLSQDLYELTLYSPPNLNGVVHYRVERCGTQYVAEGTLGPGTPGVTLPSSETLLAHSALTYSNGVSATVGIDIVSVYIETDY